MNKLFVVLIGVVILIQGAKELTPREALKKLVHGNSDYITGRGRGDISSRRRYETAINGQNPYAVVLTCSDSRAPVEHIFSAGVGDIFVIRTAGNVVSDFELGSIEYGVEHLGAKVVVVMGHTNCGAVAATLGEGADGHIQSIVDEIKLAIKDETNATIGEDLNIEHSRKKIVSSSPIIGHAVKAGEVIVIGAKYDIKTGVVTFGKDLTPQDALKKLVQGNKDYVSGKVFLGDISAKRREDNAVNGQHPYAVVLTCSDSRAPVEHIFNAGVGDIFVIRTAGNVVSDFALGSIEYGVEHLGAKVILVMGHTNCGAVAATIGGGATGHIKDIVREIKLAIGRETNATNAEDLNVIYSKTKVKESEIVKELEESGQVIVVGAKYDIKTGVVTYDYDL